MSNRGPFRASICFLKVGSVLGPCIGMRLFKDEEVRGFAVSYCRIAERGVEVEIS